MRKNWLFFIFAIILVTAQNTSNAQNKPMTWERLHSWADEMYKQGSYFTAIDYYQRLKANDERNPYYTYMLADCYRATRDYVPSAHYYQEADALAKKVYPLASYYAGLMLKQQGEYKAAMDMFNKFLTDNKKVFAVNTNDIQNLDPLLQTNQDRTITPKMWKELKKKTKVELAGCEMAIASIKDPIPVTIINAGPNVNTSYTELSPYPFGDTALLFSTMGRNEEIEANGHAKQNYHEHFMVSQKQKGYVDSFQWPLPFTDGTFRDPRSHVGNGCFSPGGDRFFYSVCKEGDSMIVTCKIYFSKFEALRWGPPIEVPGNVNENLDGKTSNTMPWVAKVGKKEVLFFSSNRHLQSRGGYDIWYSIVDPRNSSFGRPKNAGKQINTTSDEITPYYDSRVNKLYFATNGLKSMGGFDIYSADGGPTRYTNLKNMGYPINTSADELYFIKDPVGKPDAYVVSNRIGTYALKNPTCCNDIWRIQYEPKLAIMGRVLSKKTNELMPQTVVKMVDQKGEMNTYNSEDGNFLFNIARGHSYVITGDKPGYTSTRASVSTMEIKRSDPDDTVIVTIYLDSIKNSFSVSNIYYDYDKATLRAESVAALDSVVHFLTDNPSITIEIYSYTDSKGKDEYNLALSQRRAQSVMDYLEKAGIDRTRMTAKGFGSKNAAASNTVNGKDNPEGRQLNRRTEFRIISDMPTRRVIYNSALPGSMDQQEKNLNVEPEDGPDEPAPGGKKPAANDD